MNIFILTKQVPNTDKIKIDPVKNTLIRDGVESILNPYDASALEKALKIKDKNPETKIYAISMGPKQAADMLQACVAVGCDDAFLITDRKFGGSDTLATSYILANAIRYVEAKVGKADIVFAGKQAIDGDTAQVGPEVAEDLDIPQITYANEIEVSEGKVRVHREWDDAIQVVEASMPVLITFNKDEELRFPHLRDKRHSLNFEVKEVTYEDMPQIDESVIGLKGSPTRVRKSYPASLVKDGTIIQGKDVDEAVDELVEALEKAKLF